MLAGLPSNRRDGIPGARGSSAGPQAAPGTGRLERHSAYRMTRGTISFASLAPSCLEPLGPKWRRSGSHMPPPAAAGTSSAGSMTAFVARVLLDQDLMRSTMALRDVSKFDPGGALGAAGGAKATVSTPAAWHTSCSRRMSAMTAVGEDPVPMSFVPVMMTTRSGNVGNSASDRRKPRERRPPTSSTAEESRSATMARAVWPLWPQTWTSTGAPLLAADTASASVLP
mmetsp:Transcript_99380/g.286816  ORF Transcript_99380/g.286816 Transcript_99380/m.286816 type:complete len:227 (+) Transcript_99380:191-871(+)